jgi:cell division septation protein DedD
MTEKPVADFRNDAEAEEAFDRLQAAGIDAFLVKDDAAITSSNEDTSYTVHLLVAESDEEKARAHLRKMREEEDNEEGIET